MIKTLLSLFILITLSNLTIAQTTVIPDANFEQALINLGLDSGSPDGSVPTSNINSITSLDVSNSLITDLTGIQDFIALTSLLCYNNQLTNINITQNTVLLALWCFDNQLTSLDVTQNTTLTHFNCENNQLTSLDITQNIALVHFNCENNQLTSLDVSQNNALAHLFCGTNQITVLVVSQNTALLELYCGYNQLTSLDVTQNTALLTLQCFYNQLTSLDVTQNTTLTHLNFPFNQLTSINVTQNTALLILRCFDNQLTRLDVTQNTTLTHLICDNNQLSCLNIKNGNNSNITSFSSINNPNLSCLEVDNVPYSNSNWTYVDNQTSFSTNCPNSCIVGIEENNLSKLSIYPNPTSGSITIDLEEKKYNINLSLTNAIGQAVLTKSYKTTNHISFDIDAPKGFYFLRLEVDGEIVTKKIIKE